MGTRSLFPLPIREDVPAASTSAATRDDDAGIVLIPGTGAVLRSGGGDFFAFSKPSAVGAANERPRSWRGTSRGADGEVTVATYSGDFRDDG